MQDCLFCKMAAGDIPVSKVYEDDTVLAFHDIDPQAPVHFLVIPKTHIASPGGITPENSAVVAHIFEVIGRRPGAWKRIPRCDELWQGRRTERAASAFSCVGKAQPGMAAGLSDARRS